VAKSKDHRSHIFYHPAEQHEPEFSGRLLRPIVNPALMLRHLKFSE